MEPNKENIRKWVDALRSGGYQQGNDRLNVDDSKFCCLGVACEVAMRDGLEIEKGYIERSVTYDLDRLYLPRKVADWLGVQHVNPVVATDELGNITAVQANDIRKWNFTQIANGLERLYLSGNTE